MQISYGKWTVESSTTDKVQNYGLNLSSTTLRVENNVTNDDRNPMKCIGNSHDLSCVPDSERTSLVNALSPLSAVISWICCLWC